MKVLLDTNFLMLPVQYKVDVFEEVERLCDERPEFMVLRASLVELQSLGGKDKLKARATKQFVEASPRIAILEDKGKADDLLLKYAREWKDQVLIGTNDRFLREKLKEAGAGVLVLRGRSHLEKG